MFCSNCGAEFQKGAKFCSACGTDVSSIKASKQKTSDAGLTPEGKTSQEPEKKVALWKKIALGAVAFIVIVVGLAMFLTADLVDPIDRQLAAIKTGNLDAAYSETSIAFQKATSKEQYAAFLRANPILMEITDHTFTERSWENNLGTVKGTLKTKDGGVVPVEYRLVKEGDQWRILAFKIVGGK